jgi:hypothetical protein
MRQLERAQIAQSQPQYDDRIWRAQVEAAPSTGDLDELLASGLERLLSRVDPDWLRSEAQNPYRLGSEFRETPFQLVSGFRLESRRVANGPQRFARMLLAAQDHLLARRNTDFYAAPMLLAEVAQLGLSLNEVRCLGSEAERKLNSLSTMPDDLVASTIYELLVGAAAIRKGLSIEMVQEDRSQKVPDFKITSLGTFRGAIECKRRLGISSYELKEANYINQLFCLLLPSIQQAGIHGSFEVTFDVPVLEVSPTEFADAVLSATKIRLDSSIARRSWGKIGFVPLPHRRTIHDTILYSPDYLNQVFGWDPLQNDWDGLLCQVQAPSQLEVSIFTMPICLKWASQSKPALEKKQRGIKSLWADAIKQIPDGDIGFVYVAYPEGSRPTIADGRTRYIRDTMAEVWHRWTVRVPVTIINRLYPRPVGTGAPDLIESTLHGVQPGEEHWLSNLPSLIFTDEHDSAAS